MKPNRPGAQPSAECPSVLGLGLVEGEETAAAVPAAPDPAEAHAAPVSDAPEARDAAAASAVRPNRRQLHDGEPPLDARVLGTESAELLKVGGTKVQTVELGECIVGADVAIETHQDALLLGRAASRQREVGFRDVVVRPVVLTHLEALVAIDREAVGVVERDARGDRLHDLALLCRDGRDECRTQSFRYRAATVVYPSLQGGGVHVGECRGDVLHESGSELEQLTR